MSKGQVYGPNLSFDGIGVFARIRSHQRIGQRLPACFQPFDMLPYGAIHAKPDESKQKR